MPAEQLIDLIEQRHMLPPRLVTKLRAKIANAEQPMTAEALAAFLVTKNHLSQQHADELLAAMTGDGGNDEANLAFVDTDIGNRPSGVLVIGGADDEGGDSSVFTPPPTRGFALDDDDLALAPGSGDDFLLVPGEELLGDLDEPIDASSLVAAPEIVDLAPMSTASPSGIEQLSSDSLIMLGTAPAVQERVREKVEKQLNLEAQPPVVERKKRPKREKRWDSPLFLIGGGALLLMILCGVAVALFLNWGSGDQKLKDARAARDAGSYLQAVQRYEEFLDKYKRHPEWSAGRVELGLVKIRQAIEGGGNLEPALDVAKNELAAMENEESFNAIRDELAGLLPNLARGLAAQAEAETENLDHAEQLVKSSEGALELCRTAKYVPKALRDDAALGGIDETLGRVRQRRQSLQALSDSLATMKSAVAAGDIRTAYAEHKKLLREHPELTGNAELAATLAETSTAEQASVKFVEDKQAAETTERPTPWLAMLATGYRTTIAASPSTGVYCASIDGALYAFNVQDGRLLWRRYLGFGNSARPVVVGDDVLATDAKHQELLRLDAPTGRLIWRQAIGETFAMPLVVGNRAFVAADSGRLFVIDLQSGERVGYLQFGQPLKVTPAASRTGDKLYMTGDHSSIYTISLRDLNCLGVHYLGHSSGSIRMSPALVLNKIAVIENDGVETCRLRLLALGDDGAVGKDLAEIRLNGLAATPPLIAARRLIVVTDRGELDAFDITGEEGRGALTLVATREPTSQQPLIRHVLMTQGAIWIGDNRLTKYAVVPTGNRLPAETIENSFIGETFDHPFGLFGDTLLFVHRPKGRAGVVVSAIDAESGKSFWENELAVPPAAGPVVDNASRTLAFADVNGLVYRFDEQALRSRVQDQPLTAGPTAPGMPTLTSGLDMTEGRAVFSAPRDSEQVLLYNPEAARRPLQWKKLPGTLAAAMSPLGKGVIAPLEIGQVFLLDPADGQSLAAPFQPRLEPRSKLNYQPACQVDDAGTQFVITDGAEKIYLVNVVDQPTPHLQAAAEADVGPYPVVSPFVVMGSKAFAATNAGQLARFQLPSLENVGQTDLSAAAVWGPYRIGNVILIGTADEKLVAVNADGAAVWTSALAGGDLTGPPLETEGGVLLAYRSGKLEKRSLADGQPTGAVDVEHPLASGPVRFVGRIVLAAHDGTLLVVAEP